MDDTIRYQRQAELISGWDQKKLKNATVGILGSDSIAELTAVGLTALGIGNLRLMDNKPKNEHGFLAKISNCSSNKSHVAIMETALSKINNGIEIPPIHSSLVTPTSCELLNSPDVLIEATNNLNSKKLALLYGKRKKIPVIITGADTERGQFQIVKDQEITLDSYKIYEGKEQGFLVSEVLAGLICDETRKKILPLEKDKPMKGVFYYNISEKDKFAATK